MAETIYPPLKSPRDIRLLRVETPPGSRRYLNRNINVTLHVSSLDSNVPYTALSYAWGDLRTTNVIFVEGKPLNVSRNLYLALRQFRKLGVLSGYFWIDAVCINQNDTAERATQVTLMRYVYTCAENVVVWLGPGIPGLRQLLKRLEILEPQQIYRALLESPKDMTALMQLLDKPYWDRLWVLQESTAKWEVLAYCGEESFDFWNFLDRLMESLDGFEEIRDNIQRRFYIRTGTVATTYQMAASSRKRMNTDILGFIDDLCVSNERDRIYGVLALLPESLDLLVEYEEAVETVYWRATVAMVKVSRRVDNLTRALLSRNLDAGLPSWALDFRDLSRSVKYGQIASYEVPGLTDEPQFSTDGTEMMIEVSFIETIDDLRHCEPNLQWEKLLQCLRDCRSMLMAHPVHDTTMKFWRTVTENNQANAFTGCRVPFQDAHLAQQCDKWLDGDLVTGDAEKIIHGLLNHRNHFTFYIGDKGGVGISKRQLQIGDVVVVPVASKIPFALRPCVDSSAGKFRLAGGCFHESLDREELDRLWSLKANSENENADKVFRKVVLI